MLADDKEDSGIRHFDSCIEPTPGTLTKEPLEKKKRSLKML